MELTATPPYLIVSFQDAGNPLLVVYCAATVEAAILHIAELTRRQARPWPRRYLWTHLVVDGSLRTVQDAAYTYAEDFTHPLTVDGDRVGYSKMPDAWQPLIAAQVAALDAAQVAPFDTTEGQGHND